MTEAPLPLVPAEVDLRDFSWMPIEIHRLRRSKAWLICKRKPELGFYMLNLWTAAWHDTPAASLEDDDDVLADLAMCDPSKWLKVREQVLRGWVKCSDGRLYHPVVADLARGAWAQKQAQRQRTEAARLAREQKRQQSMQQSGVAETTENVTKSVAVSVTEIVTASNGTEQTGEGPERDRNGEGPETLPVVGAAADKPPAAGAAATRGTRLPADWQLPKAWGDWALAKYPQWTAGKVRDEALKFRNHWTALTGKTATKLDWLATWQNWCMSDIAHRDDQKPNGRAAGAQPDLDELTAGVQRRLGITPANPEAIDA